MKKSFKYRLVANPQVFQKASDWLELCRQLYNTALEHRIQLYQQDRSSVSWFDQIKQLPELKEAFPEYKEVGSQVLQEVLKRLDVAYTGFFHRVKKGNKPGFPRFKGRGRYNSFTLSQAGWKLDGRYLTIRNVGRFKIRLSRPVEGRVKTVTISRTATGKWFVGFSCTDIPVKPLPSVSKQVGIDVGIASFLTTSDGVKVENPNFFAKSRSDLAIRQRRFYRRIKGSHRREKSRVLVAETYEKTKNQRRDFHFKVARQLVQDFGTIYIEQMSAWNDMKHLNRSMDDTAWFGFFRILRYKAEEAGREVVEVPAKYTTQTCSKCGRIVPKDLSTRTHNCPRCGLVIDRDHNAAINILRVGQTRRMSNTNSENRLSSGQMSVNVEHSVTTPHQAVALL